MEMASSPALSRGRKTPSPTHDNNEPPLGDIIVLKEPVYRLQCVEEEAEHAMEMGDYDRALYLRMQGVALAKLCLGDPSTVMVESEDLLAKAHLNLSSTYLEMVPPVLMLILLSQTYSDQACWHAQKAMELCDPRRGGEQSSSLLVLALLGLAKGLLQKGDLNCINYLQRALLINQDLHGEEDVSNFALHEAYGDYNVHQGDLKADNGPAKKSPQPRDESGTVMSVIDYDRNEYEKGIEEYHKARELIERDVKDPSGGSEQEEPPKLPLASIYMKIARTRGKQTRHEDAAEYYQKALDIYTACTFPNEPAIAQLNFELGFTYHKLKRYDESQKVLDKAAKFCEQQHDTGGEHPLTLQVMKQQGITLYDSGDLQQALQIFEELVQLQRTQHGGGSVIVAETLKYLGDVSIALKNTSEACSYYNRALKILRKRLGSHDETVRQLISYIRQLNLESAPAPRQQEPYRPAGPDIPEGDTPEP